MRFVAFSDIHYSNYATGVTSEDVAAVERQVTDYCLAQSIKVVLFNGDRFLSHQPNDYDRLLADREQRHRNDSGILTFSLTGNHDYWGKGATSGHSNRFAKELWADYHQNLVIMDEPKSYSHEGTAMIVHALPAGFEFDMKNYQIDPDRFNVLVFHDLLAGTVIDVQSQFKMEQGMNRDSLDHSCFDMVLGGDVHIPQKIEFKNTVGGYIGSCIFQSRRDRGDSRGFIDVTLSDTKQHKTTFIESRCPCFVDCEWDVTKLGFPSSLMIEQYVQSVWERSCQGNIVDLVFKGTRADLDAMPKDYLEKMKAELKARRVNPPMKVQPMNIVSGVTQMVKSVTAQEDLDVFIKSGKVDLQGLDPTRLLEKGQKVLKSL